MSEQAILCVVGEGGGMNERSSAYACVRARAYAPAIDTTACW